MPKQRVIAYIDGFNLYHTIKDLQPNKVNLMALFQSLNTPREEIVAVKYFSAYAYWNRPAVARHKKYVKDLEETGVNVVLGQFKQKGPGGRHEEKETDINIALSLVLDAIDNKYDRAKLLTVDSDLVAAVREVKHRCPEKSILIIKPPGRQAMGRELVAASQDSETNPNKGFVLTKGRIKKFLF